MQKPYRFLVDRVTSYAEEGGAYLRRRRLRSRPFARVWRADGSIEAHEADSEGGRGLFAAARDLLAAR
jgi:hypothetical protein